ncbi:MAG: radical SAM protein [Actinomycetia bacterium]|nr:radical SAM protein [Actinomycetes bacterium]
MSRQVVKTPRGCKGRSNIQPKLNELWFHLNQSCNLKCRYCLVDAGRETNKTLGIDEIKNILEQAKILGAKRFYITGGEPYMLKRHKEIFELILDYGELIILTNATLINEDSYIPSPQKTLFQVSLDGTERINDLLRGKGSFNNALKGISALKRKGHQPVIASVVTKINIHNIPELTSFLGDIGITYHHLHFLHNRGRAKGNGLTYSIEDIPYYLEKIIEKGGLKQVLLDNYLSFAARISFPREKRYDLCHACLEMVTIGPGGKVYPCPPFVGIEKFVLGNVKEEGLEEIWLKGNKVRQIRKETLFNCLECRECEFNIYCGGGCLVYKYLEKGSLSTKDPFCEIYKYFIKKRLKEMESENINISFLKNQSENLKTLTFNCT